MEGIIDLHQDPFTRIWVTTPWGGPCGICSALWHNPELVLNKTGWPPTFTRAAGTSHKTFRQGWGFDGHCKRTTGDQGGIVDHRHRLAADLDPYVC
jgi:hypothetical protein